MTIWQIILLVAACGAIGGIVNCAISGEFNYPRFDAAAKVWRPGWIGNVLVGAVRLWSFGVFTVRWRRSISWLEKRPAFI